MAAITAARAGGNVTIIESNDRIGKKILATGNGKCNFSNTTFHEQCYFSETPNLYKSIFTQFGVEETITFFEELGLSIKNKNGYLYPVSEQATTILDLLRIEVERLGISVVVGEQVNKILPKKNQYFLYTKSTTYHFDTIVLACGSKASIQKGIESLGYQLTKDLGHKIIEPLPALVQLRCKEKYFKSIAGVRVEVPLTLIINEKLIDREVGELQITDYGISGIPVFQISRTVAKALAKNKKVQVSIDFLSYLQFEDISTFIRNRIKNNNHKTIEEFFYGMLHKKIIMMMLKEQNMKLSQLTKNCTIEKIIELVILLKQWKVTVENTNPFINAQVCSGGVWGEELTETLESIHNPEVYFAGEMIDVDGKCGGYNLQWAWSSGYIAGKNAVLNNK